MRALTALPVVALLACSGMALAGPLTLPDVSPLLKPVKVGPMVTPDMSGIMQPVAESGDATQDGVFELLGIAGGTLVTAGDGLQERIDATRALADGLFVQTQGDVASCPAGQGWTIMALPSGFSIRAPAPDLTPYVTGVLASAQADPAGLLAGEAVCGVDLLASALPPLPEAPL
jgi:hypothetical protein